MARQLLEPELFERARLAAGEPPDSAACLDIGEAYLEANRAEEALIWFARVPSDESFMADRKDSLLITAFKKLGATASATEAAWRRFRSNRCDDRLVELLSLVGNEERERIVANVAAQILANPDLSLVDLDFLVAQGRLADAAAYVVGRASSLDGRRYASLTPVASALAEAGHALGASLVYRALLDSILARGYSKAYRHGVRYLQGLDRLSTGVEDWRDQPSHQEYLQSVREAHGRKYSFWNRYEA